MGSSAKIITGYQYWGHVVILVGLGPIKRLNFIANGNTPIWTGPIESSSADADGRTTLNTELGVIDFYWGTAGQVVNPLLNSLVLDLGAGPETVPMPAWKRMAYAVCYDNSFGQQVTPPTYRFDFERETAGLNISAHTIDGDAVIPEAIYDYLMDTLYGAGIDSSLIDAPSFEAAAETTILEGLGASPDIDTSETVRETVGRLLSYIDGYLYWREGKIFMGLVRQASIVGLEAITEADLLEEPRPLNELFAGTWNQTLVNFRDRENQWEESSEPFDDPANAAIVGETVQKDFQFPWVTRREVAKILAARLGIRGGVPSVFWELTLKPAWRDVTPGQLLTFSYAALGIADRVVRVKEVRRGSLLDPTVTVQVQEEQTRDEASDYLPPEDGFTIPGTVDENGTGDFAIQSTTARLSWLPEALKDGAADGLLVAMHRPDAMTIKSTVWWTWDPAAVAYKSLGPISAFPAKGTLLCWHRIRTNHWLLRVELAEHDYDWLQSLAEEATEFFCVAAQRLYKSDTPKDEHQALSLWLKAVAGGRFELVTSTIIDVEVQGGEFGTDDLALETTLADSSNPAVHVYFGRREDFFVATSDTLAFERNEGNAVQDTGKVRHIKATVANHLAEQSVADVTASTFDRDDATMCANGTLSEEWGERSPTCYELFDDQAGATVAGEAAPDYVDVEDVDEALGAIHGGTATADQTLLAEHIDDVLGAMITSNSTIYNDAP